MLGLSTNEAGDTEDDPPEDETDRAAEQGCTEHEGVPIHADQRGDAARDGGEDQVCKHGDEARDRARGEKAGA